MAASLATNAGPAGAEATRPGPHSVAPVAMDEVWEIAGPVRLPEALDRDTLVLATGAAELQALNGHRWAEPLRDAVPRVLLADLQRLRGDARVWQAPAPPGVVATRRLRLELLALQADAPTGALQVSARWWLEDAGAPPAGGARPPLLGRWTQALPLPAATAAWARSTTAATTATTAARTAGTGDTPGDGPDAVAAAHRQALWLLARQIAATAGGR